jgi:hypothetical protein
MHTAACFDYTQHKAAREVAASHGELCGLSTEAEEVSRKNDVVNIIVIGFLDADQSTERATACRCDAFLCGLYPQLF